jgi:glycosyltransferase involved in cell wall biosynthesis
MPVPFLSIVIPAHNEEQRLPVTLQKIAIFASAQPYSIEVVVVENGSQDRTAELARSFQPHMPYLRVLQEAQAGKGLAVRRGMLDAGGDYRFICDADLSMPIEEVNAFIPPQLPQVDVAIASREAPGAVRIDEPPFRHLTGRVFNTIVRWIALPGLQDTQCGFKCFSARVAQDVFTRQTLNGWAFDVEVLFIARRRGYRVVEIPIHWYFDCHSQIHVFKDTWRMLRELVLIRRNAARGLYDR